MEQHRTVTVQRLQKSCEYENIKPVETIYLKHFDRQVPYTTYTTRNQIAKPIPVFVTQFKDLHVNCGEKAYFSCNVEPSYDPSLRVEFFFQNQKLQQNAKITTSLKLGLVELTILNVDINDAGIYLCRVYSPESGEAISAAALSVTSRREYQHSIKAEFNEHHGNQLKQHKLIEEKTSQHTIDEQSKYVLQQQLLDSQKRIQVQEERSRRLNFIGTMNNLVLPEGSNAHFHCKLEPADAKNLKIDWYFNGQPLVSSSKASSVFSSGYVALNIYCVKKSDEGLYQCVASDGFTTTTTQATLQVVLPPKRIEYQDNSTSLYEIERQTVEQCNRIQQDLIELKKPEYNKPVFITPLRDQLGKPENSTAIFEAHLEPQQDPNMVIKWYKDNVELENASRISLFFNFGYVSLKIHGLNAKRDSGTYTCVATNLSGTAQASARLTIIENQLNVITNSNVETGWDQIQRLESTKITKHEQVETEYDEKPRFVTDFYGKTEYYEEQVAMLEAKFTPVSDQNLKVEILKDGQPLEHANRISIFHGFGYVSLKIHHLNAHRDSGEYTAVISNKVGSDKVSTRLKVNVRRLEPDTQFEEGLKKIQQLESSTKYRREEYEEVEIREKPRFLIPLANQRIHEYERAYFETRLEPQNDSTMKIEFLKDGRPLEHANRISIIDDFGFVSLDIRQCTSEIDSGYYEIVATNQCGRDVVGARLEVVAKEAIDSTKMFDVNIDQVRMARNEQLEQNKVLFDEKRKKPFWIRPLSQPKNPHIERQSTHFDAQVEHGDPTLKIEFFHNDQPLQMGSRILSRYEFGYISLDIKQLHLNDSGEYKLVVSNDLGSISSTAYLEVIEESNIITSSQFPESLDKIQYLEGHTKYKKQEFQDEVINQGPRFVKQLINIEVYEGTQVQFECSVEPVNDPKLKVIWYKDKVQLNQANRIGLFFNFGYIGLNIKAAELRDAGTYLCRAINEYGESQTEARLIVHQKDPNIIRDTQFEDGLKKIQYLEGSNKYSRKEFEDIEITEKPRFLAPLVDQRINEYERAHFETRLEPQNDSTMKIEFFKDGRPLEHANRISTTENFGFVSLDIRQCTTDIDSGYYEIQATNAHGSDRVGARLEVISKKSIISDNITEDGMQKIHYLENQNKYTRDTIEDFVSEKPFFLGPLQGPDVLWEGQSCHFETKVRPVGDPNMRVEWYFNDKLLQKGHRFKTYFEFGFIALDILHTYPEDTGRYSVRAYNDYGDAIVGKDLIVKQIDSIDRTKNYDVEIDKVRELKMRKKEEEEIIVKEAPILVQIHPLVINEGETARFESRLTPINDNKLRVEWYKDNELLKAGHRVRTFNNFGHVWLEIIDCLKKIDEGLYTVKAINEVGEATSSATLEVLVKPSLILQTQLPAELAGTTEKIRQIEESKQTKETNLDQDQAHVEAPMFLEPLQHLVVHETETANFHTSVVPSNDPDLVITWFKDNEHLRDATRIKLINDFSRISMEISPCYLPDEGIYKVRATNKFGQAEVEGSLKVLTDSSIVLDSQLPESIQQTSINKIAKIEEYQKLKFYEAFTEEQNRLAQMPKFMTEYQEEIVKENDSVRFETKLTPTNDQTMKIEWFFNGKPFRNSSRKKVCHDIHEQAALEIRRVEEQDGGEYLCVARNEFGQSTYKIVLIVHTEKNVIVDSQLPASGPKEDITKMETTTVRKSEYLIDDELNMKPRFLTQIQEYAEINESESFEFNCQIEPANDPDLQVIWFKNGEILRTGTRIRQIKQFGQVSLKFDWTLEHDSAEYTCKIINKKGSDITKGALKMRTKRNIILDPQVPDNMSLENIRRLENRHAPEKKIIEDAVHPPKFITPIQPVSLNEGSVAHFETRLLPTNAQVNWFFNGQPLTTGSRFITRNEFGFVSLDILSCIDSDSGTITCVAQNEAGQDITETTLHVRAKPSLIYQTQLPTKMESGIQRLTEMENKVAPEPEDPDLNQARPTAPEFVTEPEEHEVREGEPVRFSARITGNPKAKVFWVVNNQTCVNGSKYKLSYDGMYHLDIPKARLQDHGKVEIYAKNIAGEAYRSTKLTVISKHDDYRVVLKNSPAPWYDPKVRKYQVTRKEEEINKVFDEKLTPGGTEISRWKTEQQNETERTKVQEHLVNEQEILKEQIIQQNKQTSQESQKPQQQATREKTFIEKQKETVTRQPKFETETGVHGQQMTTQTQQQIQKQELDNLEITRKLKTIEKHELERRIMNKNIYVKKSDEKIVAPELQQKLEPKEVFEGGRAIFSCKFSGIPKPKVTWYRENFLIQNSNDFQIETTDNTSTLTIRQVYKDDEGEYSVKVENKGGVEISRTNLLVSIPKDLGSAGNPPTFTKTIQSINSSIGELSRFDAILVGAKPIRVYYEKDGQIIEQSLSHKLLNEGNQYTLLILETNKNDEGLYQCVAQNAFGECRCEARLNLVQKGQAKQTVSTAAPNQSKNKEPVIVENLNSVVAKEGSSVTLKCKILNVKADQVSWFKNDSLIKPSKFFRILNDQNQFILNISEAYQEDIGVYKVVASNSAGTVATSANLQLELTENQANIIKPEFQVIHEPSQLKPANQQQISSQQKQILNQQQYQQQQQQQQQQQTNVQLDQQTSAQQQTQQQTNTQQQQSNVQQTNIQQQQQQITKPKQSLIQPPKIQPLTAQCAQKGSKVVFETIFTGTPTPLLSWYKDKKALRHSKEIQMFQENNSCSLVIECVDEEHSGMYTLQGENEAGSSKTTAQLLVVGENEQIGETVVTTTTKNETGDINTTQSKPPKKKSIKKKK